jgi:hypothetical protein
MALRRFSSRTEPLDSEFLAKSLEGATKYFRIAGYFRSSIFELVGEEIAKIPEVKIICNSELDMADFNVATGRNIALRERWNRVDVEAEALLKKERYQILDQLLKAGNVEIRVVPKERLFLSMNPKAHLLITMNWFGRMMTNPAQIGLKRSSGLSGMRAFRSLKPFYLRFTGLLAVKK